MTRKLAFMPYAQAHIEEYDGVTILISYRTPIVQIVNNYITVGGLYSMTTRKHISAFMRELGLDYSIAKKCYENHCKYNILTKEYV